MDSIISAEVKVLDLGRVDARGMSISGQVDFSNCEQIGRVFDSAQSPNVTWVFDLSELTYLDSEGIKQLFYCLVQLNVHGKKAVFVCRDKSAAKKALEITGVFRVSQGCFESMDAALDYIEC